MLSTSSIGTTLAASVTRARELAGDPMAAVVVVVPSAVNGTLARRELALATPYVRVEFVTAGELVQRLAARGLRARGLAPEPAGWMRAVTARFVENAASAGETWGQLLGEPGWLPTLVTAARRLEVAGLGESELTTTSLRGDLGDRAAMLGRLLGFLAKARADAQLAGPRDAGSAARDAIAGNTLGAAAAGAAIVLGDVEGTRLVFEVLSAYLARVPVVRVDLPISSALGAAPLGTRLAAPRAVVVAVSAPAPSVVLVRTPDPTREVEEAVREAQVAIGNGTALDQIAIVLPDPSEAGPLREALARAGIPATWQTGPALSETPAARFLRHTLALARDGGDVASWYELLSQSSLRLRRVLGADSTRGRGSWRRLLSHCGAVRGTAAILRALETSAREVDEDESKDADAKEREKLSIGTLRAAMARISTELDALVASRSPRDWARAFATLTRAWWGASADQRALLAHLEASSRGESGPVITLREASEALAEALDETPYLEGSLRDPALRVLSPMQMLGGAFEVVLATGLVQGRLPMDPREDALLSDALVDALNLAHPGAGLPRSSDRVGVEERRFAAIRSAAGKRLWLAAPRVNLLDGRPLLPSTLVLALASQIAGKRLSTTDYERTTTSAGRRSRAWPSDVARSLGAIEHLVARLQEGVPAERSTALEALLDHPTARRLALKLRSEDRIAHGERVSELRAYAGFVVAMPCKGLDGTPLSPADLERLIADPATFLRRSMLGAWWAARLDPDWSPLRKAWVLDRLKEESAAVLEATPDVAAPLLAQFAADAAAALVRAGLADDAELDLRLKRMAGALVEGFASANPTQGRVTPLEAAPASDDLPWRMSGGEARRAGSGLEWTALEAPGPRSLHCAVGSLLETAARMQSQRVDAVRWVGFDGKSPSGDPAALVPGVLASLYDVTRLARAGYYPPPGWTTADLDSWEAPYDAAR